MSMSEDLAKISFAQWQGEKDRNVDYLMHEINCRDQVMASATSQFTSAKREKEDLQRELDEALDVQKKKQLFEQTPYVVYDNRIEDNALNFSIHNITEVVPADPTIGTRSSDDPMADLMYPKTAKLMGIDGKEYRIRGFRRASYGLPMIERQEMQRLLSSVYKRDK
mgnify:FL=1